MPSKTPSRRFIDGKELAFFVRGGVGLFFLVNGTSLIAAGSSRSILL
jgi:hypothetical protein